MGVLCAQKYGGYTLNSKRIVDTLQKVKTILAVVLTILLTVAILNAIAVNAAPFMTAEADVLGDVTYTITTGDTTTSYAEKECNNKIFGGFALKLTYLSYGGLFDILQNSNVFRLNNVEQMEDGAVGDGIWGLYGALYDTVSAAGVGLALMWTLLNIIEKMSEGRLTEELLISLFAKLTLAAFIIIYGKDLCISLLGLSNRILEAFQDQIGAWIEGQAENNTAICNEAKNKMDAIKDGNVFTCCGYIIQGLVPALAMLACWVLACVQLISRILELGIRTAFMPIGVADFMTHGTSSPGMKYIKSYAGCACQGAAIYVILISGITLMNTGNIFEMFGGGATDASSLTDSAGHVVLSIVIAITMLGLMKRVDNILRDVFS